MQLFVRGLGKEASVELVAAAQAALGEPLRGCALMYGDEELGDDDTALADRGVTAQSIIHVVQRVGYPFATGRWDLLRTSGGDPDGFVIAAAFNPRREEVRIAFGTRRYRAHVVPVSAPLAVGSMTALLHPLLLQLPLSLLWPLPCAAAAGARERAKAAGPPPPVTPSFLFLLGDDIGYADFGYSGGTASTPHVDALARAPSSVVLMDFHSQGTICSPTRASLLTGRISQRDCVDSPPNEVGCSDMSFGCEPEFDFAPRRTYTVADAAAARGLRSLFAGKWHLGSLYNDTRRWSPVGALTGVQRSPLGHGFDEMNATVMPEICSQGPRGCCFNYWWGDATREHGAANLTSPTPDDDSAYLADAFVRFISALPNGAPFLAEVFASESSHTADADAAHWGLPPARPRLVNRSVSCGEQSCAAAQLFDLDADLSERRDPPRTRHSPDVMAAMVANYTLWRRSVSASASDESRCAR
eukprot:gene12653-15930_t